MSDTFVVRLGAGMYLDVDGHLIHGAPDGAQIYSPPVGFPVDTKKLQDLFKDLAGILPEDEQAQAKWTKWEVPEDVVKLMGSIAGLVGILEFRSYAAAAAQASS